MHSNSAAGPAHSKTLTGGRIIVAVAKRRGLRWSSTALGTSMRLDARGVKLTKEICPGSRFRADRERVLAVHEPGAQRRSSLQATSVFLPARCRALP